MRRDPGSRKIPHRAQEQRLSDGLNKPAIVLAEVAQVIAKHAVTFTSRGLEPGTVRDMDVVPRVLDESAFLEVARCDTDTRTAGAQHSGHEFM